MELGCFRAKKMVLNGTCRWMTEGFSIKNACYHLISILSFFGSDDEHLLSIQPTAPDGRLHVSGFNVCLWPCFISSARPTCRPIGRYRARCPQSQQPDGTFAPTLGCTVLVAADRCQGGPRGQGPVLMPCNKHSTTKHIVFRVL